MKQSQKRGIKNQVGAIGENIVANYLRKRGFTISAQNYSKKWGEIDLVAHGTAKIHFIEVKTVSYETISSLRWAVSHETWRPEENVHPQKLQRLGRTISSWILENNYSGEWQLDVAVVRIVPREKYATVKLLSNVIIDA